MEHAHWMSRCLQLARLGASSAAPNPMVGAVLVQGDRILAEGWHHRLGSAHAERDCLARFGDSPVPDDAVLYVNLEPCAHHGRTPPCADLIIERGVKRVVVAHGDPFPAVNGRGIERLRLAGIEVIDGVLADEARWMNRRFLASVTKQRPYIVLKWAQSTDGFMDDHGRSARISSAETDVLVHRWRSEEQAILVGSRTALSDDPRLDVRHVQGRSPLRVLLDRKGITPKGAKLFDGSLPTLLFTSANRPVVGAEQMVVESGSDPIEAILTELIRRSIRSLLIEGGAELLMHFLRTGNWNEARVITSASALNGGTKAPRVPAPACRIASSSTDSIAYHINASHQTEPLAAWLW